MRERKSGAYFYTPVVRDRLFSEAGNYCPEELELFSHKLDRLAAKMATGQSQVVSDVGVACAEHTGSVRETFTLFQNTLAHCSHTVCEE